MREQIIQAIESNILREFPEGQSWSRTQVENADVPPGIKHFLLSTLQRRSELEASELLNVRSEWFDADDSDYQKVLQQAVLTLGKSACFPASEWPKAVHQAVEDVLDYHISPVPLLVRFIFATESDSISATDLQRKAGYFSGFPYLNRGVDAFITRKKNQRIFKVDFEVALSHLDRQMTAAYDVKGWIKLLEPLKQLLNLPSPGLPVSFVVEFFRDKGQNELATSIAWAAQTKKADLISMTSLESLITANLNKPHATASKPGEPSNGNRPLEPVQKPDETPAPKKPGAPAGSSPDAGPDSPLPLWKKFQKGETAVEVEPDPSSPEPLWKTYSRKGNGDTPAGHLDVDATQTPGISSPDVSAIVLGAAERRKNTFIRQLFADDTAAFNATMQLLAAAPDWTTASEIIAQRVFRPYKVDIYSSIAVDFTNAVEARYSGLTT